MRRKFTVSLEMPEGMTLADMAAYIEDAVASYRGCKDPEEPVYGLDPDSVRVVAVPVPRKKV